MRSVLNNPGGQRRQLFYLVASGFATTFAVALGERVSAAATRRPVIDHLIDRARRQQVTPTAGMPRLPATATTRTPLSTLALTPRRISARRRRTITRAAIQPSLKLRNPLILPCNTRLQPLDLLIHPQQNRHHNLAALVVDRLRLGALHNPIFDTTGLCPLTN